MPRLQAQQQNRLVCAGLDCLFCGPVLLFILDGSEYDLLKGRLFEEDLGALMLESKEVLRRCSEAITHVWSPIQLLVGTGFLLAAEAKMAGSQSKYPLEVHQMFQQRQNYRKVAAGGSWAPWSHWSPCTRTCGGGVAMQTRDCQIRPSPMERRRRRRLVVTAHNTTMSAFRNETPQSQCVGVYKRFHICNDQPCPPGAKDFRQLQCEAFNHKPMEGRFYTWVPYLDAPNKCELNCRAVGNNFYARLNKTVVDGTRCPGDSAASSSSFSVCVSGMCKCSDAMHNPIRSAIPEGNKQ
ncbi:papilin-like [Anabrus simplex]|uniref:papilin-like n=1 Tax=Anabrus simplex TaxID=316456 RepID=UPI0035A32F98